MKKYLLTLVAAFIAVVSFAQNGLVKQPLSVVEMAPMTNSIKTLDPQSVPAKNLKAPKAKVLGKRAPHRAAISDIGELEGEFIVANNEWGYDATEQQLVPATVSRKGISARIEVTSANTIAIYGIDGNADENTPINATVDIENSTITIPGGQTIWTYEGELVLFMANAEAESVTADLTGTIYEGGFIVIDQVWFEGYLDDGEVSMNGYYKTSVIAPVNGSMEYYSDIEEAEVSQNVLIVQDEETKNVTVWNFHNFVAGEVVDFEMGSDKTFSAAGGEEVVYIHSDLGNIYLFGSPGPGYIGDISGAVVDDIKLVSDVGLGYVNAGYRGWVYPDDKFTIILTDGSQFEIPESEVGELVTPPAGLETKDYPFTATLYVQEVPMPYSATVKVGWDNNDVYFQGLDKDIPDAWVKGTYDAETGIVTVPVTYTGTYNETAHFFAAYGGEDGPDDLELNYSVTDDTFDYGATVMIYKGSTTTSYVYFYNGFFIGTKPTPTTPPTGLVTTDMPFKGNYSTGGDPTEATGTVKVGRDGNDVYVHGLFSAAIPAENEGWIKGSIMELEGEQYVIFPINQYVGNLSNGLSAFLTGYVAPDEEDPESMAKAGNVVFSYNATDNSYTALNAVILTRFKSSLNFTAFYQAGLVIGNTTGIKNIKTQDDENAPLYNLKGLRVNNDYKGIVIKNGKKFVNK